MYKVVDLLDETVNTGNPIIIIDKKSGLPVAGNKIANDLFAESRNKFDFFQIFSKEIGIKLYIIMENFKDTVVIDECYLKTQRRNMLQCSLEFNYAKDTKEAIMLLVKIKEDHRPYYLNILLNHIKRPAFLMECVGEEEIDLIIHSANALFYDSFACTEENIGEKYENLFQKMISLDGREQFVQDIVQAVREKNQGIIDIPIQTVKSEILSLYFSHSVTKPLLEAGDKRFFCELVAKGETLEEIECPFDKAF